MKKFIVPLSIIVIVVALDQATKAWALHTLSSGMPVEVLGRFLMFTLVFNEGGAMGTNLGSSAYYLVAATLILLFVLYYIYVNRDQPWFAYPLSFIAGGAIGNLIDRIVHGKVVDFIDVDFININLFGYQLDRWWTFNVADSAISVSIVFLLYLVLFKKDLVASDTSDINSTESSSNEQLPPHSNQ